MISICSIQLMMMKFKKRRDQMNLWAKKAKASISSCLSHSNYSLKSIKSKKEKSKM